MNKRVIASLNQTVFSQQLDNGLTVYALPMPGFQKSFAMLGTHYGGCDVNFSADGTHYETPFGVAHYLEHKMFDMPDGQNALELLSANGANPNAFTSVDHTAYVFECTDKIEENLTSLLSFVGTPYFTPESVDKERGIIGQELSMIADSPGSMVYYNMLTGLYREHPVRVPIGGTHESIAAITADTLQLCYKHFYNPSQMALVVAGNVDPERVAEIAATAWPTSAPADIARDYGNESNDSVASATYRRQMAVALPQFMLGCKLPQPRAGTDQLQAELVADLAVAALAGKSSSFFARHYQDGLLNNKYDIGSFFFSGGSCLVFGGESRDPEAVRQELLIEVARIADEGLDENLFSRLKRAHYGRLLRQLDNCEALCHGVLRAHFLDSDFFSFPEVFQTLSSETVTAMLTGTVTEAKMSLSRIDPINA